MPNQLVYKQRIASTQSLKQIFNAQELMAASRITRARQYADGSKPYAEAITRAVSAVATHSHVVHPITSQRNDTGRVAILAIGADRGMAGAYTSTIIRETNRLIQRVKDEGKTPVLYASGSRVVSFFSFRRVPLERSWTGHSDAPDAARAGEIAKTLVGAFLAPADEGGVDEVDIACTEFINMVSQRPRIIRMLPIEVVQGVRDTGTQVPPLYDFEPSTHAVLDALLPRYVRSRIHECLLEAAAAETASRQRAMKTATDNASDLIDALTRESNRARQASITSELTEIVSSADALARPR